MSPATPIPLPGIGDIIAEAADAALEGVEITAVGAGLATAGVVLVAIGALASIVNPTQGERKVYCTLVGDFREEGYCVYDCDGTWVTVSPQPTTKGIRCKQGQELIIP